MKCVEYYIADDGTKFDNEDACFAYEIAQKYKLEDMDNHLRAFNDCKEQIQVGSVVDEWWLNEAYWYIIYDNEGMEYLEQAEKYCGIIIPDATSIKGYPCLFGFFNDRFINFNEIYKDFERWM